MMLIMVLIVVSPVMVSIVDLLLPISHLISLLVSERLLLLILLVINCLVLVHWLILKLLLLWIHPLIISLILLYVCACIYLIYYSRKFLQSDRIIIVCIKKKKRTKYLILGNLWVYLSQKVSKFI